MKTSIEEKNSFCALIDLWKFISKKRKLQLFFLILLMIVASFAEVASIGMVIPFIGILAAPEALLENKFIYLFLEFFNIQNSNLIFIFTLIFCSAVMLSGIIRVILMWLQIKLSHSLGADISIEIYKKTLYQNYLTHINRNSSEIISAISLKVNSTVGLVITPLLIITSSFIILTLIMLAFLMIQPFVTLIVFAGFALIYLMILLFTKNKISKDSKNISIQQNKIFKVLQEGLNNIKDILINNNQDLYCKEFRKADLPLRKSFANIAIISGIPRFGIEVFGIIFMTILSYYLLKNENRILDIIPLIGAFALGAQKALPLMQQIYYGATNIMGGYSSLIDIINLLNQTVINTSLKTKKSVKFNKMIELKNLSFKYDKSRNYVLKNINLTINKGDKIGIVGLTGCGKSTLLDILMCLMEPKKGSVLIDNILINKKNVSGWHTNITHVPQDIIVSDSTIKENIAFGFPEQKININRVSKVAQKACLSNTIKNWDLKYETIIGENGSKLSGGQKQRLGIARALYKKATVIILDEATSSLDNITEEKIMKNISLFNKKFTLIMVAHRISSLKYCNKIVLMKNGIIKSISSYENYVKASKI